MGGFIKGHASEFDRDGDGLISKNEASLLFLRFVRQVDQNNDGELSKKELVEAESRPKGDKKKEKKDGKGKGKKEPKKTNKKNK
jgi:Ca2+-binding EF-hand superfamily protein